MAIKVATGHKFPVRLRKKKLHHLRRHHVHNIATGSTTTTPTTTSPTTLVSVPSLSTDLTQSSDIQGTKVIHEDHKSPQTRRKFRHSDTIPLHHLLKSLRRRLKRTTLHLSPLISPLHASFHTVPSPYRVTIRKFSPQSPGNKNGRSTRSPPPRSGSARNSGSMDAVSQSLIGLPPEIQAALMGQEAPKNTSTHSQPSPAATPAALPHSMKPSLPTPENPQNIQSNPHIAAEITSQQTSHISMTISSHSASTGSSTHPQSPTHSATSSFSTTTPTHATATSSATTTKKGSKSSKDDQVGMQYQRMSQREHILLRPEPYLGSSEVVTERTWVLTSPLVDGETGQVVDVDFNFIPGLYKIFDEILVNASDNVHRNDKAKTKMCYVDVNIDPFANTFTIENDGASIPVVMHPKEAIYVPELIFGHLLTSSNYDDTVARFTGGRHGYGAKLTNIFSKRFTITIGDEERGVIYRQEFSENMSVIHPAMIINTKTGLVTQGNGEVDTEHSKNPELVKLVKELISSRKDKNFTRIDFQPDLKRFQVDKLTFLPSGLTPEQQNETVLGQTNHKKQDVDAAKRSLQKEQLSKALSGQEMLAKQTSPAAKTGTDVDVAITLHKNPKLNEALQRNSLAAFPPFLLPLFERRLLDCSALMGNFGVKVRYNGKELKTNNYLKYLQKCPSFPDPDGETKALKKQKKKVGAESSEENSEEDDLINEDNEDKLTGTVVTSWLDSNWFIGVSQRPQYHNTQSGSQSLNQLSFVNSVATTRGGGHVNYVTDIIARYVVSYLNQPARKKRYNLEQDVTIGMVKQFMCVFVSCYIHNPSFDTQTKETLITHIKGPQTANPSKSATVVAPAIPESFLKQICSQTGIIQNIVLSLQQRQHRQLVKKLDTPRKQQRSGGLAIEKLDDALWAGTDKSQECTLILTEGDSAKALAVSGLSVLGRERFGVYPLKGKLLNVRDASKSSIANNKELVEILQILGLKLGQNDRSALRYGSILVMADQDHDGSHIKGLLVNAMHILCPDLVRQQIHTEIPGLSNNDRHIDDANKELINLPYHSTLPTNQLQLNNEQHHFIRLFVTPIVKATYTGQDYPVLSLQRNLNYHQELLQFQQKYGHLTPKQIDQLNATRKMIFQNKKDSEEALRIKKRQKSGLSGEKEDESIEDNKKIDNDEEFLLIEAPEQYTTSTSFDKQSQHIPPSTHTRAGASNAVALPAKRINDSISVKGKVISFYSQFAYRSWWEQLPPALQRKFRCKYYKGLGTSTSAEGKEYFSDLPSHIIDLLYRNKEDDASLDLAFSKDAVDQRKSWVMDNSHIAPSDEYIRSYNKRAIIDQIQLAHRTGQPLPRHIQARYLASRYTTITDFIHNELVQFSVADTIRSLPSTLDGLKPSQRKITFAALTKPLQHEVRVSQFAAFVSERLVYHHGEQSLTAAIVNLAQDFPGTNNIPLLSGIGQFGTRHTGGKDHASARYIYTKLGPLTNDLFPSADYDVLPQQEEEGQKIEPIHLLPILPLMIINGSDGIGTGFSTAISPHNPMHVFQATVQWLRGEPLRMIAPYSLGMTSQLLPTAVQPFDQNFNTHTTTKSDIFKLKSVYDVETLLPDEIKIPKIHAPWEVVPLKDTTDITKIFPYDNAYGVNEIISEELSPFIAINGDAQASTPTINVNKQSPVDPTLLQYDINNKPILNQKVLNLQEHHRKQKHAHEAKQRAAGEITTPPKALVPMITMASAPTYHIDNNYVNRTDLTVTKWASVGKYYSDPHSKRTLHIVELPYGVTTSNYKKFLLGLLSSQRDATSKDDDVIIDRIEERHTEQHVWFTIHCQQASIDKLPHQEILAKLKLTANVSLNNMHGFGAENNLHGFQDMRVPLVEYCVERLKCYERRRAVQITEKWRQLRLSSNISRFCQMIMTGELSLTRKSKQQLIDELHSLGFDAYTDIYPKSETDKKSNEDEIDQNGEDIIQNKKKSKKSVSAGISTSYKINDSNDIFNDLSDFEDDNDESITVNNTNEKLHQTQILPKGAYDYLFKIPIISATKEKVAQLNKQMSLLQSQVASLVHTTAKQMWLHELSQLQPKLEQYLKFRHDAALKHPFTTHAAYKAALDGTTVINIDTIPKSASLTTPTTKRTRKTKETTQDGEEKPKKTTKKPTTAKKATPTAKKNTTKKGTTTKTKKTFSTALPRNEYESGDALREGPSDVKVPFLQTRVYHQPTIPYTDNITSQTKH